MLDRVLLILLWGTAPDPAGIRAASSFESGSPDPAGSFGVTVRTMAPARCLADTKTTRPFVTSSDPRLRASKSVDFDLFHHGFAQLLLRDLLHGGGDKFQVAFVSQM